MGKLQYVTVKPVVNFWGGVEYNVHDIKTGDMIRYTGLSNQRAVWAIAERIDAQLVAEAEYGGYLGPDQ